MVVGLRSVHSFPVFPCKVAEKAEHWEKNGHEIKDWRCEHPGDDTVVLGREAELGCNSPIDRDEGEPDYHAARNSQESVFSPDVGHQGSFAKDDA